MTNKIALDTTAYTALGTGNATVTKLIASASEIGLPIIVLGEIYYGIFDGVLKHKNNTTLSNFFTNTRVEVLSIDETTAKIFGEIATELKAIGKPIQQNDMWIAAMCKQHDFTLLTADKGFTNITGLVTLIF